MHTLKYKQLHPIYNIKNPQDSGNTINICYSWPQLLLNYTLDFNTPTSTNSIGIDVFRYFRVEH